MSSVYKYSQKAFTGRLLLKDVIATGDNGKSFIGQTITIAGWIKTVRQQGKGAFAFLNINDGSHADGIQVIVDEAVYAHKALSSGASIALKGTVVDSIGEGQNVELKATEVLYVGECDAGTYPLAPKAHTLEYLRSIAHFRSRSGLFSSVFRVRNALAYATHKFYQERDFLYVHSPIITASDCEGAGEMFQVTSLLPSASTVITDSEGPDVASIEAAKKEVEENGNAVRTLKEQKAGKSSIKKAVDTLNESKNKLAALEAVPTKVGGLPQTTDKKIDYSRDFFGSPTYLTVSGQLQAEIFACSMSNVYTFGPTFRAEESRTTRHLAEFWMIEPEIAFANLEDLMQLAEDYVRYCCQYVLDNNKQDLELIDNWYAAKAQRDAKVQKKGIENNTRIFTETAVVRMQKIASSEFARITYTDAVKLLVETGKFPEVEWGIDLSSIHERYLAEEIFKGPTIVYNYPKGIKAFYMRQNEDGKTVAAMDLLCPQIGELIGGSQREERHDVLSARLKELSLHEQDFWWYMDLRKYGSIPHSGFGLGFERLIMFATGMENIRDVIPFPRYPDSCQF